MQNLSGVPLSNSSSKVTGTGTESFAKLPANCQPLSHLVGAFVAAEVASTAACVQKPFPFVPVILVPKGPIAASASVVGLDHHHFTVVHFMQGHVF